MKSAFCAAALGLVMTSACGGGSEKPAPPPESTPAATPASLAPAVGIYVTNEVSGDLTVIDAATRAVVATVPLGKRPRGLAASRAVSPDGTTIVTANGPSNDISIIDAASRQVTATVPAGNGPWGVAVVERP